ncbi:MAG: response regulator [Candidatus Methanoperedens sp.]|nr:response regulator [Candidatus Methanoperedens sp.]
MKWNISKTTGERGMQVKILVVDDEKGIVSALKMSLESDNYKVIEAYTGDGAIRKACSEAPDLILLDIMLPDVTGYEICNKIKKHPLTRSIPIIMLTGMGETGRIAGLELGADDYITKPFDLNELKAKIRTVLHTTFSHR